MNPPSRHRARPGRPAFCEHREDLPEVFAIVQLLEPSLGHAAQERVERGDRHILLVKGTLRDSPESAASQIDQPGKVSLPNLQPMFKLDSERRPHPNAITALAEEYAIRSANQQIDKLRRAVAEQLGISSQSELGMERKVAVKRQE